MIIPRLVVLFFLFGLINSNPIQQNDRKGDYRLRRSLNVRNWDMMNKVYKHFHKDDKHRLEDIVVKRRSEIPLEFRPVEGPINIEQVPAMLAARYVKRYPFSQQDDPAIIG